jgi:hypothetical protein
MNAALIVALALIVGACSGSSSTQLFANDAAADTVDGDAGGPICTSDAGCSGDETCPVATGACVALPTPCSKDDDCASRSDGKNVCDTAARICAECAGTAGCGDAARCVSSTCISAVKCKNSLDCPQDQVCDTATHFCVACLADADCPDHGRCGDNVCRTACVSDKECTPLGELCDAAAGYCVNCRSSADCAANQYCGRGACLGDVCAAGTSRCDGNAVLGCNDEGSALSASFPCAQGQTCAVQGSTASCHDWICPPLVTGCDAEKVVTCSADGLTQTVTDDCGARHQVCVAATCKPVTCQADSFFCVGSELRRCSTNGDSSMTWLTCTPTQYCDEAGGTCKAQVCTPDQPACNGAIAATCNMAGSGYKAGGIDCASSAQICVKGSCSDLACAPAGKFCDSNTVRQCSADGLSSTLLQTCSSSQYCDAPSASCKAQICAPNQAVCNGTIATVCNNSGSGYAAGGTDCATSGQSCAQGACKSIVCTPNTRFCDANTIRQCSANGASSTVSQTCAVQQYCDPAGPSCKAQICPPGQPACDGNVATTCNPDGSGYTGARQDCTASSKFCADGQCGTCFRVDPTQWVRTRYTSSTPKNVTIADGTEQITALVYYWVGWFEYDVPFPSPGNYRIKVRLADDGWHEGAADALYNHIQVFVDSTKRLEFDANTTAYDDGQRASGDRRFHNTTGTVWSATGASHVVRVENLADNWVSGDDLSLYVAYLDICRTP